MSEAIGDALRVIIREELRAVLAEIMPKLAANDDEPIPVERAPELLGLPRRSVEDAVRRNELPAVKLGRKLAVRRSALVAWRETRTPKRRPRAATTPTADPNASLDDIIAADFDRMTSA